MTAPAPAGSGQGRAGPAAARSKARLAAVQALYQMEFTGADRDEVMREFLDHRLDEEAPGEGPAGSAERRARDGAEADAGHFRDIVEGVVDRQAEIDGHIVRSLTSARPLRRLDRILRAILRAGVYELLARPDVPPKVVINEYVDLAHAFFDQAEPALVNGVLDNLARRLKADAAPMPPDEAG